MGQPRLHPSPIGQPGYHFDNDLHSLGPEATRIAASIVATLARAKVDSIDADIENCLRYIGSFLQIDTLSVCTLQDAHLRTFNEWRSGDWLCPSLEAQMPELPWWGETMSLGHEWIVDSIADCPTFAQAEKTLFQARHTCSVVSIPIAHPEMSCVVAERRTVRKWCLESLALLDWSAHTIASAKERQTYHQNLIERAEQAESHARRQKNFVSQLVHELRSPLTAIMALTDTLAGQTEGPLTEEQQGIVADLLGSSSHLNSIVKSGSEVAKLGSNSLTLCPRRFDIRELLDQTFQRVKNQANDANIVLERDFPTHASHLGFGIVRADPRRIVQIVHNLLHNAICFTPEGGKVFLRLRLQENSYDIEVEDSGEEIPVVKQAQAFDCFARLRSENRKTGKHPSSGLELALVKHITTLHGGTVRIDSTPEKGNCFCVTLPRNATIPTTAQF